MKGRYIAAIILIILGVGFMLDQMNFWVFGSIISTWWPLIIIAIGLTMLTKSRGSVTAGLIVMAVGIVLQADELNFLPWGFWGTFWPLVLIAVGLGILFSRGSHRRRRIGISTETCELDGFVMFSGAKKIVTNDDFKGGEISAMFGGYELDLRNADIKSGKAVLDIFAAFGGVEIKVPNHWKIDTSGVPLFGGMSNKARQRIADNVSAPVLVVNYFVMFGGVEIKN